MNFLIVLTLLVTPAALGFKLKENESKSCICPMTYAPLCGSDLKTYTNECFFACAQAAQPGLTISSLGECPKSIGNVPEIEQGLSDPVQEEEEDKGCMCSMDYVPVCGTDMQTYGNLCSLNCVRKDNPGLEVFAQGECPSVGVALVDAPVQMKPTPFRGRRASHKKTDADAAEANETFCLCTREYRPLCGSDGVNRVTYPNPCELKCAQKSNPELTLLTKGPCLEDVE